MSQINHAPILWMSTSSAGETLVAQEEISHINHFKNVSGNVHIACLAPTRRGSTQKRLYTGARPSAADALGTEKKDETHSCPNVKAPQQTRQKVLPSQTII